MRVSNILSLSAIGASGVFAQSNNVTGQLGDATVTTNNPVGKSVLATLPKDPFWNTGTLDGNVQGYVSAKSGADGSGVDYEVSFSNLPKEGGPFIYHIHVAPVPTGGNCTETLAHLDQFIRGEDPACDSSRPQSCQQGDLSGKYGKINSSDPFTAKFHDPYTSLSEGVGSYFGNRSVVFHFANKTRITCANFSVVSGNGTTTPYPTGTGVKASQSTAAPTSTGIPINAAGVLNVARGFAVVPVVAAFFALL
ncbi:superoxide dismutase [Hypoxylon trugodes]|uniref:superoxide dismutase n=1 Tax=Hypoxylon trugodes TaxID=326681 RepID=UPI00219EFE3C|nr:superoxide dismutase [Hypoxylon trugodes]KAI1386590.1 superoxide dismutase [Hypoxylon trugodes]